MDRRAIEAEGIPGYTLMQRAGEAACAAVRRHWPAARAIAVLCGPGNNGGDGYVVARLAQAAGLDVRTLAVSDPKSLRGDAASAWRDFAAAGGRTEAFRAGAFEHADLVVDALLGTGFRRPLAGEFRAADRAAEPRRPAGPRARRAVGARCGFGTRGRRPRGPRHAHARVRRAEERLLPRRGRGPRGRARVRGPGPRARRARATRLPCCAASTGASRAARCRHGCARRTRAITGASSSWADTRCRARRGSQAKPHSARAPASSRSQRARQPRRLCSRGGRNSSCERPRRSRSWRPVRGRHDRNRPGARDPTGDGTRHRHGIERSGRHRARCGRVEPTSRPTRAGRIGGFSRRIRVKRRDCSA